MPSGCQAAYVLGHTWIPANSQPFQFAVVCDYADWMKIAGVARMTCVYDLNFSNGVISLNAIALQPLSDANRHFILLAFAKMANRSDDEKRAAQLVEVWNGKQDFNAWWFQMVQQLGG